MTEKGTVKPKVYVNDKGETILTLQPNFTEPTTKFIGDYVTKIR